MTPNEFKIQIGKIENVYARKYPKEVIDLIWQAARDLDIAWLARTVNHFIATLRLMPMAKDFGDAARAVREVSFNEVLAEASHRWAHGEFEGLKTVLARDYGGAKSLAQAVELEKSKLRAQAG